MQAAQASVPAQKRVGYLVTRTSLTPEPLRTSLRVATVPTLHTHTHHVLVSILALEHPISQPHKNGRQPGTICSQVRVLATCGREEYERDGAGKGKRLLLVDGESLDAVKVQPLQISSAVRCLRRAIQHWWGAQGVHDPSTVFD
eukprot:1621945-Rhodomonas_salina.5